MMTPPYIDRSLPIHPQGATCADCVWFRKCSWLVGRKGPEVQCDWEPSKFLVLPVLGVRAGGGE